MSRLPSRLREDLGVGMVEFRTRPARRARGLRRNLIPAERKLRAHLSRRQAAGTKFSRQMPSGPFIRDFVSRAARMAIELDGGQHDENEGRDRERTAYIEGMGCKVVRFWNNEVLEAIESVVSRIEFELRESPPPAPPASGSGEA
jgi:very-short-patch-repair endonuclease